MRSLIRSNYKRRLVSQNMRHARIIDMIILICCFCSKLNDQSLKRQVCSFFHCAHKHAANHSVRSIEIFFNFTFITQLIDCTNQIALLGYLCQSAAFVYVSFTDQITALHWGILDGIRMFSLMSIMSWQNVARN